MPPYGGEYRLDLPEMGMVGRATAFDGLMRELKTWRKGNGYPIGLDFENEVKRELAKKYPAEFVETDSRVPPSEIRYGLDTVMQGTAVLARFNLEGRPFESAEEANHRASICDGCPWNMDHVRPCGGGCGGLKELVLGIVGNAATRHDANLRVCSICKCWNAAAVWIPMRIQALDYSDEQREQFLYANEHRGCWKGEWLKNNC